MHEYGGGGGGLHRGDLRQRQFREITCFQDEETSGRNGQGSKPRHHDGLQWADSERDEVTLDDVDKRFGDEEFMHSTMIYNRLITLLSGGAWSYIRLCYRSAATRSGAFLRKRYNPMTPMRGIQLIAAGRSTKARMCRLSSTSGRARRTRWSEVTESTPIKMMRIELEDAMRQHVDRLQEYKLVKEKAVNLIDNRERLRDTSAMDIGNIDGELYIEGGRGGNFYTGQRHRCKQCPRSKRCNVSECSASLPSNQTKEILRLGDRCKCAVFRYFQQRTFACLEVLVSLNQETSGNGGIVSVDSHDDSSASASSFVASPRSDSTSQALNRYCLAAPAAALFLLLNMSNTSSQSADFSGSHCRGAFGSAVGSDVANASAPKIFLVGFLPCPPPVALLLFTSYEVW